MRRIGLVSGHGMDDEILRGPERRSSVTNLTTTPFPLSFALPGRDAPARHPSADRYARSAASVCPRRSCQTPLAIAPRVPRELRCTARAWAALDIAILSAIAESDQKAAPGRSIPRIAPCN